MREISNINAFITGGVSGLGLATAKCIIEGGGKVCLVDINAIEGEKVSQSLGDNAFFVSTDVTDEKNVDNAVAKAIEKFGAINLLVNCAGIAPSQRVLAKDGLMPTADFTKVVSINLNSTFCVCRSVVNAML